MTQDERPYMIVYKDKWRALTDTLQTAERNKVMAAFFDWLTYGSEPKGLTKTGRGFFEFLKTSEENGKKRGAPIGNQNRRNNSEFNSDVIENGIENSNQDELKNQRKFQSSTKAKAKADAYAKAERVAKELNVAPTLDECRKYAQESGLDINPERFFKYYKARGWKVKGDPITDWQALMESWTTPDGKPALKLPPVKPVRAMVSCPKCDSLATETRRDYAICHHCGRGYNWDFTDGDWVEDKE